MKTLSELMTDYRAPLLEAWDNGYETPKSKRGMFKGRTKESLKAELEKLKNNPNKTAALKTKEHELEFALRAKNDFGNIDEAWDAEMHTAKKNKGMFAGKTKAEIRSSLNKNKKTAKNDRADDRKEPESLKKKIKQQEFALRAKNNFGKVSESIELREGAGISFEHLLKQHHADVDAFIDGGELTPSLFDALYEYYFDDMPYGIAKGRSGDPHQWVFDRFNRHLEQEGLVKDQHADFQETDDPLYGYGEEDGSSDPLYGQRMDSADLGENPLEEGKTLRKCKGKGCGKKCTDGKEFCSTACKKSVAVKESYGPFSKKGTQGNNTKG